MHGQGHFFSAFTNSKFLCIDMCLTVLTTVLILSSTLGTATVSAVKVKADFQNASRLNSAQATTTTTSRPGVTVEDDM